MITELGRKMAKKLNQVIQARSVRSHALLLPFLSNVNKTNYI